MKPSKKSVTESVTILSIGDIHFHKDAKLAGDELIERLIAIATEVRPTIIILLGDILDTHETLKNVPWKQAEHLFKGLTEIAPIYVLIGNHDLCSASEFLTDNHFFNPYKIWPNITIVDTPLIVTLCNLKFVLSPYVPPGRFVEALNTLFDLPGEWRDAACIFAHQEFEGVVYNNRESSKADRWSEELPMVISGHIHDECQIGGNIFYQGSSRQVKFDEGPDKKVWCTTFTKGTNVSTTSNIKKIPLGLKAKKEVEMDYDEVKGFDFELCKSYYIKLKIKGSSEQFKLFRKHPLYAKLVRHDVKIHFVNVVERPTFLARETGRSELTFEDILGEVVKSKRQSVQDAYREIYLEGK